MLHIILKLCMLLQLSDFEVNLKTAFYIILINTAKYLFLIIFNQITESRLFSSEATPHMLCWSVRQLVFSYLFLIIFNQIT